MHWHRKGVQRSPPRSSHPYYPSSLILPNYVPNDRQLASIVAEFSLWWVVVLSTAWIMSSRLAPQLGSTDKMILLWFTLCGTLHTFFEGYFVLNRESLAGKQDLFAQLWKEYALSDSRYLSGDYLVLCAEMITFIFWGPLSYATVVCIVRNSPWRHPLQVLVSVGHVYGDCLYLATSFLDLYWKNVSYSRPEAYYLWFYFFFLNSIWIFVPSALLYQSVTTIAEVVSDWQQIRKLYQPSTTAEPTIANERVKTN